MFHKYLGSVCCVLGTVPNNGDKIVAERAINLTFMKFTIQVGNWYNRSSYNKCLNKTEDFDPCNILNPFLSRSPLMFQFGQTINFWSILASQRHWYSWSHPPFLNKYSIYFQLYGMTPKFIFSDPIWLFNTHSQISASQSKHVLNYEFLLLSTQIYFTPSVHSFIK